MSFSDSQQHSSYIWLPINLSEKKVRKWPSPAEMSASSPLTTYLSAVQPSIAIEEKQTQAHMCTQSQVPKIEAVSHCVSKYSIIFIVINLKKQTGVKKRINLFLIVNKEKDQNIAQS